MRDLLLVTGGSFFLLGVAFGVVVGYHLSKGEKKSTLSPNDESEVHE
jgi:hypothetical protein